MILDSFFNLAKVDKHENEFPSFFSILAKLMLLHFYLREGATEWI